MYSYCRQIRHFHTASLNIVFKNKMQFYGYKIFHIQLFINYLSITYSILIFFLFISIYFILYYFIFFTGDRGPSSGMLRSKLYARIASSWSIYSRQCVLGISRSIRRWTASKSKIYYIYLFSYFAYFIILMLIFKVSLLFICFSVYLSFFVSLFMYYFYQFILNVILFLIWFNCIFTLIYHKTSFPSTHFFFETLFSM